MTGCACGHGRPEHPAGRCTVTLPAIDAEELPAWSCPCRRYVGERDRIDRALICAAHPVYWASRCAHCREARELTLALASVQSCTVHAAVQRADLRVRRRPLVGGARGS